MNVALAGNPNSGKTTLFNHLTGSRQSVGNWPGVTVEKKVGYAERYQITLIDLPGIYSLSPYSIEETLSRNFLLKESPDAIINIIDGTNPERNLYLTLQLMELRIPMVLAINMADVLLKRGTPCDAEGMAEYLGIPAVPISAKEGENLNVLMEKVMAEIKTPHRAKLRYDPLTQRYLSRLRQYPEWDSDFFAMCVLQGDIPFREFVPPLQRQAFEQLSAAYERESGYPDREIAVAACRYRTAETIVKAFFPSGDPSGGNTTRKLDSILLHPIYSLPIFCLLLLLMFYCTFSPVSAWMGDGMRHCLTRLIAQPVSLLLLRNNIQPWVHQLLIDGIFTGVSSVLCFLPQLAILFFFLSLLEDSGYMARAAFLMDGILSRIGLSGKAFIPLLMGFGCTTPAVLAARTMEQQKDRKLTVLLTPFMSCSAKLPVYALFVGVFFEKHQWLVLFSLYALGMVTAMLYGFLLRKTVFRIGDAPFLLELPPYRLPHLQTTLRLLWEKTAGFLKKAGSLIFAMSVLLWILQHFTWRFCYTPIMEESILWQLGGSLAPLFAPLGFGSREASVSLLCGLMAKESVVSALTVLYHNSPAQAIATAFTPAGAYSFIVFCLLYPPCISALSVMAKELGSLRWLLCAVCLQYTMAYGISFLFYRILGGDFHMEAFFIYTSTILVVLYAGYLLMEQFRGNRCKNCGSCKEKGKL